jgi:hypothetical protein
MPNVKIHGNQLTLPEDLRQVLTSSEDDEIEAEEVEEGVLLKRSPAARKGGIREIRIYHPEFTVHGQRQPHPWDIPKVIILDERRDAPDFTFTSLAQAKEELALNSSGICALARSPTKPARLVVHIAHGPEVDLNDLRFLEPLTAQGIDVVLGMIPRTAVQ